MILRVKFYPTCPGARHRVKPDLMCPGARLCLTPGSASGRQPQNPRAHRGRPSPGLRPRNFAEPPNWCRTRNPGGRLRLTPGSVFWNPGARSLPPALRLDASRKTLEHTEAGPHRACVHGTLPNRRTGAGPGTRGGGFALPPALCFGTRGRVPYPRLCVLAPAARPSSTQRQALTGPAPTERWRTAELVPGQEPGAAASPYPRLCVLEPAARPSSTQRQALTGPAPAELWRTAELVPGQEPGGAASPYPRLCVLAPAARPSSTQRQALTGPAPAELWRTAELLPGQEPGSSRRSRPRLCTDRIKPGSNESKSSKSSNSCELKFRASLFTVLAVLFMGGLCFPAPPVSPFSGGAASVEDLGIPFADRYSGGDAVYARNVWDLQAFSGRLYIGAGNYDNSGPAPNAGPVPILAWDPDAGTVVREGEVDEEEISRFEIVEDTLYIPGADPREGWELGNLYRREPGGNWRKLRTIPRAIHAAALTGHAGSLYVGLKATDTVPWYVDFNGYGSAVAVSEDRGGSWKVFPLGGYAVQTFLQVSGRLYATDVFPGPGLETWITAPWPGEVLFRGLRTGRRREGLFAQARPHRRGVVS